MDHIDEIRFYDGMKVSLKCYYAIDKSKRAIYLTGIIEEPAEVLSELILMFLNANC